MDNIIEAIEGDTTNNGYELLSEEEKKAFDEGSLFF